MMLVAVLSLTLMDSALKWLAPHYPPLQVAALRGFVALPVVAAWALVHTECLYHQRMRPALEYVELPELVRVATRLETAYGYPLDIEFGIEGPRLFVLQARPVATFFSLLQETLERHPLEAAATAVAATIAVGGPRP